jgi:hypothetical protein
VLNEIDPSKAVSVVQHDYTPKQTVKMDGCIQHPYPRKNWSSFVVFNCNHPSVQKLTPKVVNQSEPAYLHRFEWLDDSEIGNLDIGWNYLEGWYPQGYNRLKAVHFTLGGPWFEHKKTCDFAPLWIQERENLRNTSPTMFNMQKNYLSSGKSLGPASYLENDHEAGMLVHHLNTAASR